MKDAFRGYSFQSKDENIPFEKKGYFVMTPTHFEIFEGDKDTKKSPEVSTKSEQPVTFEINKIRGSQLLEDVDPLEYMQILSRGLSTPFKEDHRIKRGTENPNIIYWGNKDSGREVHFGITAMDPKTFEDVEKKPRGLLKFLWSQETLTNNLFCYLNFSNIELIDFGKYRRYLTFGVTYAEDRMNPDLSLFITPSKDGEYKVFEFYGKDPNFDKMPDDFSDIEKITKEDFRPYFIRMLELLSRTPKERWYNPISFSPEYLERSVDSTVAALFSGNERENLEKRIKEARIQMRKDWISVPRLNLGAIVMPTPGQKKLDNESLSGAPLLVEYLDQLGVMPREEAEEVIGRKVANYLVHQAGFQQSREKALRILQSLRGKQPEAGVANG